MYFGRPAAAIRERSTFWSAWLVSYVTLAAFEDALPTPRRRRDDAIDAARRVPGLVCKIYITRLCNAPAPTTARRGSYKSGSANGAAAGTSRAARRKTHVAYDLI